MSEQPTGLNGEHFIDNIQNAGMEYNLSVYPQGSNIELSDWDRHTRNKRGLDIPILQDVEGIYWIGLGASRHVDLQASLKRNGTVAHINNLTHMDLTIGGRRQVVTAGIPHSLDLANHSDERAVNTILSMIPKERIDSNFKMIEVDPSSSVQRVKVVGSDKCVAIVDSSRISEFKNVIAIEPHDKGKISITYRIENFPEDLLKTQ